MNRFVNSVLIGVVAFFGLLAVFSFSGLHPAGGAGGGKGVGHGSVGNLAPPGDLPAATEDPPTTEPSPDPATPTADPEAHIELAAVTAEWGDAGDRGTELVVRLELRNPGPAARATALSYETVVDGITFDSGQMDLDEALPAGESATVAFTTALGPEFAAQWWTAHAEGGDSSRMDVRGQVEVAEASASRTLPFEWSSSWQGDIGTLFSGLPDCAQGGPGDQAVCIESATAHWDGATLQATLTVRNLGPGDLQVEGGGVAVRLAGVRVGTADLDRALLPAGASVDLPAAITFQDSRLGQWWPRHVQACEESEAQVQVDMGLQDADGYEVGTASWETTPTAFRTAFVCNGAA